jgi:hypothetical protein
MNVNEMIRMLLADSGGWLIELDEVERTWLLYYLAAAEDLAAAAYNVSNGALDPVDTHGALNDVVAKYYKIAGVKI